LIVLLADQLPVDRPPQHGLQVGIRVGLPGLRSIQPLCVKRLESGQQLEAQQPAESKRDLALAVAIHVVLLDLHLGVVAEQPFDHRRDFRG
jgi:hypothetical protein